MKSKETKLVRLFVFNQKIWIRSFKIGCCMVWSCENRKIKTKKLVKWLNTECKLCDLTRNSDFDLKRSSDFSRQMGNESSNFSVIL